MSHRIETLDPMEISRLLVRHRRGETLERYQPQLDAILREILAKVVDFVPAEEGAILLDDPRAKMFNLPSNSLTIIAALGDRPGRLLGQRLLPTQGLVGRVYTSGAAIHHDGLLAGDEPLGRLFAERPLRSMLGVPVLLGNAICGVILLVNRSGQERFSDENTNLIEIFAAYISSSIQNTIDGLRARELAQRDDLTGLHNDRYLHHRLRAEIRRADEEQAELSLLFLDLDRFKSINDRHGHLVGSRTLHLIGILLGGEAPAGAVAARYGGDEFVIILPRIAVAPAREVAENLREKVATTAFAVESRDEAPPITVTISIGVASLLAHVSRAGRSSQRANQLIRLADKAMYQAKADGRDRVAVAAAEGEV